MSFKPLDTDRSNNVSPIAQYEESPMRHTIVMLKRQEVGQLLGGFEDKLILVIDPANESDHHRDSDGRTATGTFYLHCLSRFRRKHDRSLIDFVVIMGVYTDTFVKTDAGWRFASINVNVTHTNRLDTQSDPPITQEANAWSTRP